MDLCSHRGAEEKSLAETPAPDPKTEFLVGLSTNALGVFPFFFLFFLFMSCGKTMSCDRELFEREMRQPGRKHQLDLVLIACSFLISPTTFVLSVSCFPF